MFYINSVFSLFFSIHGLGGDRLEISFYVINVSHNAENQGVYRLFQKHLYYVEALHDGGCRVRNRDSFLFALQLPLSSPQTKT